MQLKLNPDLVVCNCCQCGALLACNATANTLPGVGGRIKGRPYCDACLEPRPIQDFAETPEDQEPYWDWSMRQLGNDLRREVVDPLLVV